MPQWLFERFVGLDETTMWRWLRDNEVDLDTRTARDVHPGAVTVHEWVLRRRGHGPTGTPRVEEGAA